MRRLPFLACLLAATAPLAAQTPPPTTPPPAPAGDVVVTGRRLDGVAPERRFVEAVSVASRYGQLARIADPVCPVGFGLKAADARDLAARIRRVARAVGARVAAEGCSPNLVLIVVVDRAAAIEHWRVRRPDFFAGLTQAQVRSLAAGKGPAAAWQIIRLAGAGGRQVSAALSDMFDYYVVPDVVPSRISSPVQVEASAAFVVVEAAALARATTLQLADYAAMRTLAVTDPAAAVRQPQLTILTLLDEGGESPESVTHWDTGFLRALYATPPDRRGTDQRRAMVRSMQRGAAADGR